MSVMNQAMKSFLFFVVICGAVVFSRSASALDQGDFYAHAGVGRAINKLGAYLVSGEVGYVYSDTFGIGADIDQRLASSLSDPISSATQGALLARWILEPVELAVGFGEAFVNNRIGTNDTQSFFSISTCYLKAITPSLSAKLELRGDFPFEAKGLVTLGLGARLAF